jgi:hypothetical protein|tara:strand:+ start:2359 stop:2478 length:120 start_codon:yes stop_codon:yes gene_type:complete
VVNIEKEKLLKKENIKKEKLKKENPKINVKPKKGKFMLI